MRKILISFLAIITLLLLVSCGSPKDGLGDLKNQEVNKANCEKIQEGTTIERVIDFLGTPDSNFVIEGKGRLSYENIRHDGITELCYLDFQDNKYTKLFYDEYYDSELDKTK